MGEEGEGGRGRGRGGKGERERRGREGGRERRGGWEGGREEGGGMKEGRRWRYTRSGERKGGNKSYNTNFAVPTTTMDGTVLNPY